MGRAKAAGPVGTPASLLETGRIVKRRKAATRPTPGVPASAKKRLASLASCLSAGPAACSRNRVQFLSRALPVSMVRLPYERTATWRRTLCIRP